MRSSVRLRRELKNLTDLIDHPPPRMRALLAYDLTHCRSFAPQLDIGAIDPVGVGIIGSADVEPFVWKRANGSTGLSFWESGPRAQVSGSLRPRV